MSLKRYAAKRDQNEGEIVSALRAVGATVVLLDEPMDALVGYRGMTFLLDFKGKRGRVTPSQEAFIAGWRGGPAAFVKTVEDALREIGATD